MVDSQFGVLARHPYYNRYVVFHSLSAKVKVEEVVTSPLLKL